MGPKKSKVIAKGGDGQTISKMHRTRNWLIGQLEIIKRVLKTLVNCQIWMKKMSGTNFSSANFIALSRTTIFYLGGIEGALTVMLLPTVCVFSVYNGFFVDTVILSRMLYSMSHVKNWEGKHELNKKNISFNKSQYGPKD